jgi:hypothetical protein
MLTKSTYPLWHA